MPFSETIRTIRLALKSLLLHKLRSGLTMLGIVIGVFSVIAMIAIGEGASAQAQQQVLAALGLDAELADRDVVAAVARLALQIRNPRVVVVAVVVGSASLNMACFVPITIY